MLLGVEDWKTHDICGCHQEPMRNQGGRKVKKKQNMEAKKSALL